MKNLLMQYVPMLYDENARRNIDNRVADIGDKVAILSVKTKDIDPLLGCITEGLEMEAQNKEQVTIHMTVECYSDASEGDDLEKLPYRIYIEKAGEMVETTGEDL